MPSYFHFMNNDKPFLNRFDIEDQFVEDQEKYIGIDMWNRYIGRLIRLLNENSRESVRSELLIDMREYVLRDQARIQQGDMSPEEMAVNILYARLKSLTPITKIKCPRIFISHRQKDTLIAKGLAYMSLRSGFQVWLDVWDPDVHELQKLNLSDQVRTILVACIVEIALLNCTHVLACFTERTRGSFWVPYEYGRIFDVNSSYQPACAITIYPKNNSQELPGYLYLGVLAQNVYQVENWMQSELISWSLEQCKKNRLDQHMEGIIERILKIMLRREVSPGIKKIIDYIIKNYSIEL